MSVYCPGSEVKHDLSSLKLKNALVGFSVETGRAVPHKLLFGRNQINAFDTKYQPFMGRATSAGPAREYNGIQIVPTDVEDLTISTQDRSTSSSLQWAYVMEVSVTAG